MYLMSSGVCTTQVSMPVWTEAVLHTKKQDLTTGIKSKNRSRQIQCCIFNLVKTLSWQPFWHLSFRHCFGLYNNLFNAPWHCRGSDFSRGEAHVSLAFCCRSLASLSRDKGAGLGPTVAELRAGGNNDSRMITDTHSEVCVLPNPRLN